MNENETPEATRAILAESVLPEVSVQMNSGGVTNGDLASGSAEIRTTLTDVVHRVEKILAEEKRQMRAKEFIQLSQKRRLLEDGLSIRSGALERQCQLLRPVLAQQLANANFVEARFTASAILRFKLDDREVLSAVAMMDARHDHIGLVRTMSIDKRQSIKLWAAASQEEVDVPVHAVSEAPIKAVASVTGLAGVDLLAVTAIGVARCTLMTGYASIWQGQPAVCAAQDLHTQWIVIGRERGAIQIWSPELELIYSLEHAGPVGDVRCLPGGRVVAASTEGNVRMWDIHAAPAESSASSAGNPASVASKPATRRATPPPTVASVSAMVIGGALIGAIAAGAIAAGAVPKPSEAAQRMLPQQLRAASAVFKAHEGEIRAIDASGDGNALVTCGTDDTVRLWDANERRELAKIKCRAGAADVRFIPGSNRFIASAGLDGCIRLWDGDVGRQLDVWEGHEKAVRVLAFTPDGRHALSCGDDKTIRLWDVASGWEVRKFADAKSAATCLTVLPDGKRAVSGGHDGRLRVWNLGIE